MRRAPASDADGMHLGNIFGHRQESRHRSEWPPEVVLVEPRGYHPDSGIGHFHRDLYNGIIEELYLVDPDNLYPKLDGSAQFTCIWYHDRVDATVVARDYSGGVEAIIHGRLEDLGSLAGYLGAAKPADKLLAFPAEHSTSYYFYPSTSRIHTIHLHLLSFSPDARLTLVPSSACPAGA